MTQQCVQSAFRLQGSNIDFLIDQSPNHKSLADDKLKISLIDSERTYYEKYGPNIFPAVVINNQTFRGQLEIEAVFYGICSGFFTVPMFC